MNKKTISTSRLRRLRVQSTLGDRYQLAQRLALPFAGDKRRDIYEAAGYDKAIDYQKYLARYLRQDVARRIVNMVAEETWRMTPSVLDGLDEATGKDDTPFTTEWIRVAPGRRRRCRDRPRAGALSRQAGPDQRHRTVWRALSRLGGR